MYYESCLDENDTVESLGAKPMVDLIAKLGGWNVTTPDYDANSKQTTEKRLTHMKFKTRILQIGPCKILCKLFRISMRLGRCFLTELGRMIETLHGIFCNSIKVVWLFQLETIT